MKIFLRQFLLLSGFYAVISYFLSFFESKITIIVDNVILLFFIMMVVILCFKKSFDFLAIFLNKYPKSSLYLISLGIIFYIGMLLFMISGAFDGYKSTTAKYNGNDYESIFSAYIGYIFIFYCVLAVLILLWVTYVNFIKQRIKRTHK